jgi:DNA-directed RNA polymerase subunit RPC12/RpoP
MPTNEERREVAEKLREKHYERQGTFEPQSMEIQALNRLDDLLDCLPKRRNLFLDLADLIEPEERTCRNESCYWHLFRCSNCGCEVEGGDEYGHNSNHGSFNYCPNCGDKVVE